MTNNNQDTETVSNSEKAVEIGVSTSMPASQNALVHGVYAKDIVLPWESPEDFKRLFDELQTEWKPAGRTEYETVLTLARWNWVKHRLMRSTEMAFRKDSFGADLEKSGAKSWADVASYLQKNAADDSGVMAKAKNTLKLLDDTLTKASAAMDPNNQGSQDHFQEVQSVKKVFEAHVLPVYGKVFDKGNKNPITEAYHPDYLEKIVRLEASIDARIDKALQRLVTLKEYKCLVNTRIPSKQLESASIQTAKLEKPQTKSVQ